MKIINTPKNNNTKFKVNNWKVAHPFLSDNQTLDLRTLSTNTIIEILELQQQKRENLFANTELSKKLNK